MPRPQPDNISGRNRTLDSNSGHIGYASMTAASTAATIVATSLHKLHALLLPLHRRL